MYRRSVHALDHGIFRLQQALSESDPYQSLMDLSGTRYDDREELKKATSRVTGIPESHVEASLVSLFTRHADEWAQFRPLVSWLPAT